MLPNAEERSRLIATSVPRSCVGRNLASMELLIIISSILRRYEFVLEDPNKPVCHSHDALCGRY